jgi:hypothetical protein
LPPRLGQSPLDPAGLAAAADLDLSLDHDRVAELLGGLDGLIYRAGGPPFGHRHTVLHEELLALVFEESIGGRYYPAPR